MINKLNRFMYTKTWCAVTIVTTGTSTWFMATADNGSEIALWTFVSLIGLFNSALSVRNLLHGGKE